MRINSTTVSSQPSIRSVSNDRSISGSSSFSPKTGSPTSAKKGLSPDAPINHEQLMSLAADFKNGVIDKDEANSRFVKAVVDHSLHAKLSDKDRDAMTKDIADIFGDDPDFMNKLQTNLRNLS